MNSRLGLRQKTKKKKKKEREKKFLHPQFIADAIHKKMGIEQIVDQDFEEKKIGVTYRLC